MKEGCLLFVLTFLFAALIYFLWVAFAYWIICLIFDFTFRWGVALVIAIILSLIRSIFR